MIEDVVYTQGGMNRGIMSEAKAKTIHSGRAGQLRATTHDYTLYLLHTSNRGPLYTLFFASCHTDVSAYLLCHDPCCISMNISKYKSRRAGSLEPPVTR